MSFSGTIKLATVGLGLMALLAGGVVAAEKITITGSTTVLPIAQKAAEVYMGKNPGVSISVAGTGSGDGVKAIIDGTADIGDSSREIKEKEKAAAKEKGVTVVEHVVAMDCIVPIVNPANKLTALTMAQLKDIFTGKITKWKDVGGDDKPIAVISRDSSSGTFEFWNEKVLKGEKVLPAAQLQASNGAVAQAVAGNKYAIGYVGIGYVGDKVKGLTVDGVTASVKAAKDKTYPVARDLYMFTRGEPKGPVKAFIDFLKSAEGQKLVVAEGFVPLD